MTRQLGDGYHLSLSIGKGLWDDLVGAALPVQIKQGRFDLGQLAYDGVKQLQVKEKVRALLEDRDGSAVVGRVRDRAADLWRRRRKGVYRLLDDMVHVEGEWKLEVDKEGTEFHYGHQKIGVDAHVKAVASGTAYLLGKNVELPFVLEKRLGASCHLGDIRYDSGMRAIIGQVQDPMIDFGDHVVMRLLNRAGAQILAQQVDRFNPVPILKKDQVEELVSPASGPLKVKMGVDDVTIQVTEGDLTLKVKFGFGQKQLEG